MTTTPLWRDTRLQSLAVMALLVVGALVLVADTLLSWRAEAGSLALYEERTALLESKASTSPVQQGANQALDPGEGKILLDAQTSGLVSAEFQRLLSNRVERVGAVIRRVDVPTDGQAANIGDPQLESLERIRLTADIEVLEQSLPDLMYAIEAGSPVMVVDNFKLRLNRKVDMLGGDQTSGSMDQPLSLNVTLSAFREKEPQS
ncbi:type II secretion system protein GspM [Phyllobacterium sp. 0TCS1.6C]|uniref:type II secretion system protein GspM n=1 Tax=unclassified Phyllobacterium TaxID=2638441 RepID=UPI00226501CB|nr:MULTISPECIES: type II secretion system protein GspM [unclassified Phyllobacterium]MCX8278885.1 type II secretion system protein GspM [Phyllobacterium sp. 0TCS1.6C]MCX8293669.1 type II secretion system protein GspM [Phyllobacterium sp. 0TCS1.6A]